MLCITVKSGPMKAKHVISFRYFCIDAAKDDLRMSTFDKSARGTAMEPCHYNPGQYEGFQKYD